jgi:hypothetical protein
MQGLHIQLAAKPKYICQNSKTKSVYVRKSTRMAWDQSGFWLSSLITCITTFRSEKMARSLGHIKNRQQVFSIDSNSSSMCLTTGYWSQPFPIKSKCFAILDEGSRTLACIRSILHWHAWWEPCSYPLIQIFTRKVVMEIWDLWFLGIQLEGDPSPHAIVLQLFVEHNL